MSIVGRLKSRIKRTLGREAPARPPRPFDGRLAPIWADLAEHYALAYQTIGAAIVSSWEVIAAELHLATRAKHGSLANEWVTRFSDGLVPTLAAVQAAERAATATWKAGTRAAQASGVLADAIRPLRSQADALGAEVETGWPKTVEHLEPILAGLAVDESGRSRLLGVGAALRSRLDARAQAFGATLEGVATAPSVEAAFLDALETWRHAAAQDVEVALDQVRAVLVAAAKPA
jgi:hypothetical protein